MSTLILQNKQQSVSFVRKMESMMSTVQLWLDRHHQRRQLAKLDMHQLQDMGFSFSQIEKEIGKPFWK